MRWPPLATFRKVVRVSRLLLPAAAALLLLGASDPAVRPLDEVYRNAGYTSVKRAHAACERVFGEPIDVPTRKPRVAFTHRFGRCVDAEGTANDRLEIEYVNEDEPRNHYQVLIYRQRFVGYPPERFVIDSYALADGTTALLARLPRHGPAEMLFFVHRGMQYVLSADSRIGAPASGEALADIANGLPAAPPVPIGRIAYNDGSLTVAEAAARLDYRLFVPERVPGAWTLELKTYPPSGERIYGVRLHFMDERDEHLIVGIAQTKTFLPKLDGSHGRIVFVRGRLARFSPWANSVRYPEGQAVPGGILRWIEDGTLIEMDSAVLTKKQMVQLAGDMQPALGLSIP